MKTAKKRKAARTSSGVSKWKLRTAVAFALVVAGLGGGGVIWSSDEVAVAQAHLVSAKQDASARRVQVQKLDAAKAAAAAEAAVEVQAAALQASEDATYALAGYKTAGAGTGLHYKFADNGSYTCGYFSCTFVEIIASKGCNAGVYIAASILRGGTSIGFTNGISAGLPPDGSASVLLQNTSGDGDTFSLTDVHCMGQ